ncbi:MAG: hypothetical protein Q9207_006178 [Kuettlingeria erythrocarpa]
MGARLTKGQPRDSPPVADGDLSEELLADEQLMMDMADEGRPEGVNKGEEELLEMAEEFRHQEGVENDNSEGQEQTQASTQRSRLDSDTPMTGVAEMLPVTAEIGSALENQEEIEDGADREKAVVAKASLVRGYDSSYEGSPEKSPVLTQTNSEQSSSKDIATPGDADGNPESASNTSPGQYYGDTAGGTLDPTPEPRMRTDEELTNYSNSEYEYESSSESSDSDFEAADPEAADPEAAATRTKKQQRSSPSKVSRPAGQNPEAPKVTKRQLKIQEYASQGVELDSNGTKKGVVRGTGRDLEYLHRGQWILAVYHYEMRKTLLRVTDDLGSYDEEPARGVDDLDRTAYKPDHKGVKLANRDERPDILFQWEQTFEPPTDVPDFWYDGSRIILDVDNHPLRRRPELPLTLSGQCEGLRLEFYKRLNPSISMSELKARMPPQTCRKNGLQTKAVQTAALSNRTTRERIRSGIKAWVAKQGSKNIEYRLLQLMPQDIQRQVLRTNSTKCFRDLTALELDYVESANAGAVENLAKAGSRLLDEQTRRERQEKHKKGHDGVLKHAVVEDARRERPPLVPRPQGFRYSMPASAPSVAQTNNIETPKRPGPSVATAPPKRRRKTHLVDQTSDAEGDSEMKEHSGTPASGTQKSTGGSDKMEMSVSGGAPSGVDFRYKRPVSFMERFSVQNALDLSRDDFQRYTGSPPNINTDRTQSYAYQVSQLQDAFEQLIGIKNSPPQLKSWGPVGSFDDLRALAVRRQSTGGTKEVAQGDHADSTTGYQGSNAVQNGMLDMEGPTLVEQGEKPLAAAERKQDDQAKDTAGSGRCAGAQEPPVI